MSLYAGIDVGSLSADTVLVDDGGNMVASVIIPTGNNSRKAGTDAFMAALQKAGASRSDVAAVVATGYSRARIEEADRSKTEIACHARGAFKFYPDVRTVIDIGGQDSKAIRVDEAGRVVNFTMNDKCAAGTGRFLEVMAGALQIPLDRMGDEALDATEVLAISSTCTVFAESEVVGLISQGKAPKDISLAVSRAIARRTAGLATRVGIEDRVVMTGGVAKNRAVVKLLSEDIGHEITLPEEPQIIGALGAALFARENKG